MSEERYQITGIVSHFTLNVIKYIIAIVILHRQLSASDGQQYGMCTKSINYRIVLAVDSERVNHLATV